MKIVTKCGSIADIPCMQDAMNVDIPRSIQGGVSIDTISDRIGKGRRAFIAMCGLDLGIFIH